MNKLSFSLTLILLIICIEIKCQNEISGLIVVGDSLYMVDDGHPGTYFKYKISAKDKRKGILPINISNNLTATKINNHELAFDIEDIGMLYDGSKQKVLLSERLGALIGESNTIALYPRVVSEFGSRGLEALDVKPHPDSEKKNWSRVIVVWEGGYPELDDLPASYIKIIGRKPVQPFFYVHDLEPNPKYKRLKLKDAIFSGTLKVPINMVDPEVGKVDEPFAQRFRIPAVVWYNDKIIALLSSENSPLPSDTKCKFCEAKKECKRYVFKMLQQYDLKGNPVGKPIDLNNISNVITAGMHGNCNANWEGLCWLESGKTLLIINDKYPKNKPPTAVVIPLPKDWK